MSINSHRKIKSTVLDEIESLLYSLMDLGEIKLPWDSLKTSNYELNNIYANIKECMEVIKYYYILISNKNDYFSK